MPTILKLFLWWWPELPGWLRYSISAAVGIGAIVGWILESEAWVLWILLILIAASMALYGEPSDAEKKGYRV